MTGHRLGTAFVFGSLLVALTTGCGNSQVQDPPTPIGQAGESKAPHSDVAVCREAIAGYQLVMDDFALLLAKPAGANPSEPAATVYRLLVVYERGLSKNLPLAQDEALKKALGADLAAATAIRQKLDARGSQSRLSDVTPSPEWDGLGKELSAACARIAPAAG